MAINISYFVNLCPIPCVFVFNETIRKIQLHIIYTVVYLTLGPNEFLLVVVLLYYVLCLFKYVNPSK